MEQSIDTDADALYIRLGDAAVAETTEIDSGTMVDLAADGSLIGIEVIGIHRQWPLAEILDRYDIDIADERLLRAMYPWASGTSQRIDTGSRTARSEPTAAAAVCW